MMNIPPEVSAQMLNQQEMARKLQGLTQQRTLGTQAQALNSQNLRGNAPSSYNPGYWSNPIGQAELAGQLKDNPALGVDPSASQANQIQANDVAIARKKLSHTPYPKWNPGRPRQSGNWHSIAGTAAHRAWANKVGVGSEDDQLRRELLGGRLY